jgi:hypothetical protein
MSDGQEERWSPVRNPYAIAVSQSQWALWAAQLFGRDAKEHCGDEQSQIYARQIFGQLRALQRCADMMAGELRRLGVDQVHRDELRQAISEFEAAVPGANSARDILEHFDEYARGEGNLVKKAMRDLGLDVYQAAAMYWGGGYDPSTEEVTEGPFVIVVPAALKSAERLQRAIYAAGKAVDRQRASP